MNKVTLTGRLTADPDVRRNEENGKVVAMYTLAVRRPFAKEGQPEVDYVRCVCFNARANWVSKCASRGTKIEVTGSLRTSSYTGKDGKTCYKTEVLVAEQEFAESKRRGIYEEYERLRAMIEGEDVGE